MQSLLAATGLITVAASTPGPNNFIVMRAAAVHGLVPTLPLIAGIVVGSLAMLGLANVGIAVAIDANPAMGRALSLISAAYLVFLGLSIALPRARERGDDYKLVSIRIQTPLGLFLFQLANPKTWLMIVTALSSGATFIHLLIAMSVITTGCLLLWSWFGSLLQARLQNAQFARWFNLVAGGCLAGSAFMVLL